MLFESVPNISEGRDLRIIDECVAAVERAGARMLHRTSDAVHNRSVLTMTAGYEAMRESALALAAVTIERIDLRTQSGVHPRIGALDVLPFIPLRDARMEDAVRLAREVAAQIWERLRVPTFLYGEAALTALRVNLANVRQGEFEGLDARFELERPDFGDVAKHASAGAIAVGARGILIAFNVELDTDNLALARSIARRLRQRSGGLRTLKALGLPLRQGVVQVSLNVTDYAATPLYRIVEIVRREAALAGVRVLRSELIGCLPYAAAQASTRYYLGISNSEET